MALVAIALIVLGGIYGMSNKSNNRRQMPSLYSWRMELIVTIMYCSILPMTDGSKNIECIVLSIKRI
jgi:hypothetical protein